MTLLTTDHADSGEILPWDTVVLEVPKPDKPTVSLTAYLRILPPVRALRLADADPASVHDTGELPLMPTGAEVAVASRPTVPNPSGPIPGPRPGPTGPQPGPPPPPARPDNYRAMHRRPAPVWAGRVLLVGLGSVGTVVLELAGLAALAVIR